MSADACQEWGVVVQLGAGAGGVGVVVPVTGAQRVRLLSAPAVSQGGVGAAGLTMAALPLRPAMGRVSCQSVRVTGPVGSGPVTGVDPGVVPGAGWGFRVRFRTRRPSRIRGRRRMPGPRFGATRNNAQPR